VAVGDDRQCRVRGRELPHDVRRRAAVAVPRLDDQRDRQGRRFAKMREEVTRRADEADNGVAPDRARDT
jgi:hypothetical protein